MSLDQTTEDGFANAFALNLLMPEGEVRECWRENPTIWPLVVRFGVTNDVAIARARQLHLVPPDRKGTKPNGSSPGSTGCATTPRRSQESTSMSTGTVRASSSRTTGWDEHHAAGGGITATETSPTTKTTSLSNAERKTASTQTMPRRKETEAHGCSGPAGFSSKARDKTDVLRGIQLVRKVLGKWPSEEDYKLCKTELKAAGLPVTVGAAKRLYGQFTDARKAAGGPGKQRQGRARTDGPSPSRRGSLRNQRKDQ